MGFIGFSYMGFKKNLFFGLGPITSTLVNNAQRITNRNHHFITMKNCTMLNSVQICVTKTVNHCSTYSDLCAGSHLLAAQMLYHRVVYWDDCALVCILCKATN